MSVGSVMGAVRCGGGGKEEGWQGKGVAVVWIGSWGAGNIRTRETEESGV